VQRRKKTWQRNANDSWLFLTQGHLLPQWVEEQFCCSEKAFSSQKRHFSFWLTLTLPSQPAPWILLFNRSLMPEAESCALIMEKTPAYFSFPPTNIPFSIKEAVPKAKLLLVLCEPAKRAFSDFVHEVCAQFDSCAIMTRSTIATDWWWSTGCQWRKTLMFAS